jgi:hypothetical protein
MNRGQIKYILLNSSVPGRTGMKLVQFHRLQYLTHSCQSRIFLLNHIIAMSFFFSDMQSHEAEFFDWQFQNVLIQT